MTLHAFDDIDDAIDATRAFLWPFDLGRWAKLAFVAFFLGGTGGVNPFQFGGDISSTPGSPGQPTVPQTLPSIGSSEFGIIAAIMAALLVVVLGFILVGAVMEFVFVESLRRETVTIRRYWSDRWKQGLRLFGFRLLVGLLLLGVVGGVFAVALGPALLGAGELSFALLALAVPVFFVLAILSALVNGFTTSFVVPVMIAEDRTLLSAWRRFWPTLRGEWKEYAAYAFMRFVLQIAAGIVVGIAMVVALVAIAIPLGILGAVGVGLLSVVELAGYAVIAVAVLLFVVAALAVSLLAVVPVQTFLHYYALLVLGDTNEAFDLITEQRAAVRE